MHWVPEVLENPEHQHLRRCQVDLEAPGVLEHQRLAHPVVLEDLGLPDCRQLLPGHPAHPKVLERPAGLDSLEDPKLPAIRQADPEGLEHQCPEDLVVLEYLERPEHRCPVDPEVPGFPETLGLPEIPEHLHLVGLVHLVALEGLERQRPVVLEDQHPEGPVGLNLLGDLVVLDLPEDQRLEGLEALEAL